MVANWGDATFEACALGSYGTFLSDYLRRIAIPYVFVDIGANQGLYSLVAASSRNCRQAIALEPVAATYALLRRNIAANGRTITALPFGISVEDATLPIYIAPNHSGAASLHGEGAAEHITIRTAEALAEHIQPALPIVVKIDVEGHETFVARSLADASFADRIEAVFCEVDERWINPDELRTELRRAGLSRFEQVGSGFHYDLMARR